MIDWIEGKVYSKEPARLGIEKGGIAISIIIPLSTYESIGGEGEKVKVFTYLNLKNEKLELFGFGTLEERRFFTDLLLVDGVGPYTALRVLANMTFPEFKSAIFTQDVDALSCVKGISEKRASKLILELRGRYEKETLPDTFGVSAIKALTNLGVDGKKARQLVREVKAGSLEEFIKEALRRL
jgi:Holliday junction DNA helicase RuvA